MDESDSEQVDAIFESVSRYFRLLSDPNRVRILHTVCNQERSVGDIAEQTGNSQANVSQHLRSLLEAGVVKRRRDGTFSYYSIADPTLTDVCRMAISHLVARNTVDAMTRQEAMSVAKGFTKATPNDSSSNDGQTNNE
jgi:DNA-binding transcriptional ArsR family regulator